MQKLKTLGFIKEEKEEKCISIDCVYKHLILIVIIYITIKTYLNSVKDVIILSGFRG